MILEASIYNCYNTTITPEDGVDGLAEGAGGIKVGFR